MMRKAIVFFQKLIGGWFLFLPLLCWSIFRKIMSSLPWIDCLAIIYTSGLFLWALLQLKTTLSLWYSNFKKPMSHFKTGIEVGFLAYDLPDWYAHRIPEQIGKLVVKDIVLNLFQEETSCRILCQLFYPCRCTAGLLPPHHKSLKQSLSLQMSSYSCRFALDLPPFAKPLQR